MKILASVLLTIASTGCGESAATLIQSGPTGPSPTLGVQGVVYDSAFRPIGGARVEIVDGWRAGGSAVADSLGRFSFDGVIGERTMLRATSERYDGSLAMVPPKCTTCSTPWVYFYLAPSGPAADVAGDYTLAFSADRECADPLPAPLMDRQYSATIVRDAAATLPAGTAFQVNVSGAPFLANFHKLSLHLAGNYRTLYLGDSDPGLLELIGQNTGLAIGGWATGSVNATEPMVLALDGYAHFCPADAPITSWMSCAVAPGHSTCRSSKHRLTLTRR